MRCSRHSNGIDISTGQPVAQLAGEALGNEQPCGRAFAKRDQPRIPGMAAMGDNQREVDRAAAQLLTPRLRSRSRYRRPVWSG